VQPKVDRNSPDRSGSQWFLRPHNAIQEIWRNIASIRCAGDSISHTEAVETFIGTVHDSTQQAGDKIPTNLLPRCIPE
jgi:hypothetical protein